MGIDKSGQDIAISQVECFLILYVYIQLRNQITTDLQIALFRLEFLIDDYRVF